MSDKGEKANTEGAASQPPAAEDKTTPAVPAEVEKKAKKAKRNLDTPPVHDMIIEALETLRERKGVTLYAIKRYLEDNFKFDSSKMSPHIRKALMNGVEKGEIIRTRGTGALGRFKVKNVKPSMIKKRKAPEDYVELPMSKPRANRPKKKAAPAASTEPLPKQKSTKPSKADAPSPKSPKPKRATLIRKKK